MLRTAPAFDMNRVIEHVIYRNGFLLDTTVSYTSAYYGQKYPSVAFDGTNYLVVWTDERPNSFYSYDIYGARVSPSGTVHDPAGIAISTAPHFQKNPTVAFDGTNYFVVWEDFRNGSWDIYGVRVDTSGSVLDSSDIPIAYGVHSEGSPYCAFGSTHYLVVWTDNRNVASSYDIYGTRIDTSGNVLDPTGIAISTAVNSQYAPSVAFDGLNYLVVWNDIHAGTSHDIYGTRVTQAGVVLDPSGIAISSASQAQESALLEFDGTNYLVVWQDNRNISSSDIYGARVDTSGTVLDSLGIAISTAPDDQSNPSICFDNTQYFVVWHDDRTGIDSDVYGSRVSTSGSVLDVSGIAISAVQSDQWYPATIYDGIHYSVVWQDKRHGGDYPGDIYTTQVNQSGVVQDTVGLIVSTAVYDQWSPSAAFDGTNYLVVWHDYRSDSSYDIYGTRVDQSGSILDPLGIAISTDAADQWFPSVAFDGTNYLVVWDDERGESFVDAIDHNIYGARVSPSGFVLDSLGIAISTATNDQRVPTVTFGGSQYLVMWEDARNGLIDIYGARVDTSGYVNDPLGIAVSSAVSGRQNYPSVSFDGTNYFVVWENYTPGFEYFDIFGTRVDTSGMVLDPSGIIVSDSEDDQWFPDVSFDGTNYLVVWSDSRSGSHGIYAARVNQEGTVLDSFGVFLTVGVMYQFYPSVTFDGTNYVIVWEEWLSGSENDIYGAVVTPDVNVIDTFSVSLQLGNQFDPVPVHGPNNDCLILYSGFTEEINGQPAHTLRIWGTLFPFPGSEEKTTAHAHEKGYVLDAYPNPFKDKIDIRYHLLNNIAADLKIYDVTGRLVRQFDNKIIRLSDHIIWDGTDDENKSVPAGIYIIQIESHTEKTRSKIIKVN